MRKRLRNGIVDSLMSESKLCLSKIFEIGLGDLESTGETNELKDLFVLEITWSIQL